MIRAAVLILSLALCASAQAADKPSDLPDPHKTPGLVAADGHKEAVLCAKVGGETYSKRHRSGTVERSLGCPKGWQADHLVPIAAGGADALANLWCQPPDSLVGLGWQAKDLIDDWAWQQICHKGTDPAKIQAMFLSSAKWTVNYCQVFPDDKRCH